MKFTPAYDFKDIMIQPSYVSSVRSRSDVVLEAEDGYVPVSASNMKGVGTFSMAAHLSKYKMRTYIHGDYTIDQWNLFLENFPDVIPYVVPTIGSKPEDVKWLSELGVQFPRICIDVANGHTRYNLAQIGDVRYSFPDAEIVYGNVANTGVIVYMNNNDLMPDIIKVGIGSGSVCTTRLKTGVGLSQASAIHEFATAPRYKLGIMSDGGCRNPGDVVKALALGAEEVMLGGMLAYTNQSENVIGGHAFFEGSSAKNGAQFGNSYATSEGLFTERPCVGDVDDIVLDILGGMRSSYAYLNCSSTTEVLDSAINNDFKFRVVNRQTDNYS